MIYEQLGCSRVEVHYGQHKAIPGEDALDSK